MTDKQEWRMMFAGMAMQGLLAKGVPFSPEDNHKFRRQFVAESAFALAADSITSLHWNGVRWHFFFKPL